MKPHSRRRYRLTTGIHIYISFTIIIGVSAGPFDPDVMSETSSRAAATGQHNVPVITPAAAVNGELSSGETRSFQFEVTTGRYARIVVQARGGALLVRVSRQDGQDIMQALTPTPAEEPVRLSLIADRETSYRLELSPWKASAPKVGFQISMEALRPATAEDVERVAGGALMCEAQLLAARGGPESMARAAEKYEAALKAWQKIGDRLEQATAISALGSLSITLNRPAKAAEYYQQALAIWRSLGNRSREAQSLSAIGWAYYNKGDLQEALEYYDQALPIRREIRDSRGQAQTLTTIGQIFAATGEPHKALSNYEQALPLAREAGDAIQEAFALNNLGLLYIRTDQYQKGLDCVNRALPLWRASGNRYGEADALNTEGIAYERLGEFEKSLDHYNQALRIWRELGYRGGEADALGNIGSLYWQFARIQAWEETLSETSDELLRKGLEFLNQALAIRRLAKQSPGQADYLTSIGLIYDMLGERDKALESFTEALRLDPERPPVLINVGLNYYYRRDYTHAFEYGSRARDAVRRTGDKSVEAHALRLMALAKRRLGNLDEALSLSKEALNILEAVRSSVADVEIKTSHLADVGSFYSLCIDILWEQHRAHPSGGFDAEALEISESGRARGLLDYLLDARVDIHKGVDAHLLERELILQRELNAKEQYRMRLLNAKAPEAKRVEVERELARLLDEYQKNRALIRANNPRYAALTQPSTSTAEEIQKLLDDDTVLLEHWVTASNAFLWVVTSNSITMHALQPGPTLLPVARRVYELATSRNEHVLDETPSQRAVRVERSDAEYRDAASELSRLLLGPAAAELGHKRLIFVSDSSFTLPFAALPAPPVLIDRAGAVSQNNYRPLILDHEVLTLPSASVLSVLRQEMANRKPAPKSVLVVADPVFAINDPRVRIKQDGNSRSGRTESDNQTAFSDSTASSFRTGDFRRLRFSREEADAIAAVTPPAGTLKAVDFNADKDSLLKSELDQYRILHFATHTVIDTQRPELSGVVLSLVDAQGKPRDGFLRLHEIYDLKLNTDLVVLSACETALGKPTPTEGLVGLTRGFMYAGAPRIVASLWRVDDRATAELMKRFYKAMFVDGMRPPAALRAAQIQIMSEKGWSAPYFWAGFALQGEWK